MKKTLAGLSLLALSASPAFASDVFGATSKDGVKEVQEIKDQKPSKDSKTDTKPAFGEKEQQDAKAILNELMQQHNNASPIVKVNREPTSLATQSALVAKTSSKVAKDKKDDMVNQLTSVASSTINKFKQSGIASWYGRQFHGKKTASGERFDMNALTAAHRSLPFGCYVKVTNKDNGKSVIVKINDRGPFHGNRVLDLSYGAAKAIGITQKGMGNVSIERIDDPTTAQLALNQQ